MSQIDRRLLDTAGINISKAAGILRKSRQAISRGIASGEGNYFRAHELYKLLQHVRAENKALVPLVKNFIDAHYQDHSDLISTASNSNESILGFLQSDSAWCFAPNLGELACDFEQHYRDLLNFLSVYQNEFHIVLQNEDAVKDFNERTKAVQRKGNCTVFTYVSNTVMYCPITFLFSGSHKKVFILVNHVLTEVSSQQCARIYYNFWSNPGELVDVA